jgi:DNA-binding PadR family transcriptional regulator
MGTDQQDRFAEEYLECPCSGKTLTRLLRPAIMVHLTKGPSHGYQLAQDLAATKMFSDHPPDPAGIYRTLREMEDRGYVVSEWDTADSGPARRVFHLTDAGRGCLHQWHGTLREYHDAVAELLKQISNADVKSG